MKKNIVILLQQRNGIIVKVNALNGTPLVKEGDTIKKGSVLIGGFLEGKYTGTRYVHANGSVYAKVWYSQKEKIELKQSNKVKTGSKENKYSVKINNFTINFYKTLSKFKNYDTIEEIEKVKIFSNFYLPIQIIKNVNYEINYEEITYDTNQAKKIGEEKAKKALEDIINNKEDILNTYINYNETNEFVEVEVIYEILEEISAKEKIVF